MLTAVQFQRPYGIYNRGEIAGFAPAEADRLVSAGVAARVEVEAPPPAPPQMPEIGHMTATELAAFCEAEGLAVALDKLSGMTAKRQAVRQAWEAAQQPDAAPAPRTGRRRK